MKLPNGVNPAHAASNDQTRYVLNGVKFQGNLAVATNGRILVAAIATREDDDDARDAIVPTRAMIAGFKAAKGKRSRAVLPRLVINSISETEPSGLKTVTITDKQFDRTTVQDIDGKFPSFEQIFEDPAKHTLKLAFNAKLLADIAKALGTDAVELHLDPDGFKKDGLPAYGPQIYVTSNDDPDKESIAVLMPMRSDVGGLDGNSVLAEVAKIKAAKAAGEKPEDAATVESQPTTPQ